VDHPIQEELTRVLEGIRAATAEEEEGSTGGTTTEEEEVEDTMAATTIMGTATAEGATTEEEGTSSTRVTILREAIWAGIAALSKAACLALQGVAMARTKKSSFSM